MPAFYLSFLAVLLAGLGGRDQVLIMALTQAQGRRPGVLIVALASCVLTALFAAWVSTVLLTQLPPPARAVFAAIALGLAGAESLVLAARPAPREPTHSLGALLLVLVASQVTDAPRFLVFGMSVAMAAPVPAGLAGIVGGAGLCILAWAFPQALQKGRVHWVRRGMGAILLLAAFWVLVQEFGYV